ncbi:hypothetical protein AZH47_02230 [Corynebacterium striatum]|nr:hypothetical protein AZH47_02230 [Corynebacterium striatum]
MEILLKHQIYFVESVVQNYLIKQIQQTKLKTNRTMHPNIIQRNLMQHKYQHKIQHSLIIKMSSF